MVDFNRNNLDKSSSPYLQQHKDNPINWQEWSKEVLDYAKKNKKIILVSVGYSTCHWCHVMAAEAFSNKEIANYLNKYFVSIKVDREQRPDIDNYMMSFLVDTQGHGGWPLNVFLTSDKIPILAVTYVSVIPKYGMMSFIDLLHFVKNELDKNRAPNFMYIPKSRYKESVEENDLIKLMQDNFDSDYGGFGFGMKFPPHNTLLFLISYYEKTKNKTAKEIIETTLVKIATGGLHDHLQGGFYRYCTDRQWEIPHFEKMLYDQAMLLWVYSAAYKVFKNENYKIIAEKIIKCLQETFEEDGLFYSAHDADTEHEEGMTYTWTEKELKEHLGKDFNEFSETYALIENFEGKIHLVKKKNTLLPELEAKLLRIRKNRRQPFVDRKIVASWNALTGIGLLMAYRYLGNEAAKLKSRKLFQRLLEKHYVGGRLFHSSLGASVQKKEFIEDYASLLLFATFLYQEDFNGREIIEELHGGLMKFNKNGWIESSADDFQEIKAQTSDHPTPSSNSLAEFSRFMAELILGKAEYTQIEYDSPLEHDFFNLLVFIKNGNWHELHIPKKIEWDELPLNSIKLFSEKIQDCYNQKCTEYKSIKELISKVKENGRID